MSEDEVMDGDCIALVTGIYVRYATNAPRVYYLLKFHQCVLEADLLLPSPEISINII